MTCALGTSRRPRDGGSAALLAVVLQAVAVVACIAVVEVAALVAAVARADAGAELAALAAATSVGAGMADPAVAASDIAERNGVALASCVCHHLPVKVVVTVTSRSLIGLPARTITRTARATLTPTS